MSTPGRGGDNQRGRRKAIWWVYFVFVYESRTMKPVEIVLRRGE
jgi:hypothetical protein